MIGRIGWLPGKAKPPVRPGFQRGDEVVRNIGKICRDGAFGMSAEQGRQTNLRCKERDDQRDPACNRKTGPQ